MLKKVYKKKRALYFCTLLTFEILFYRKFGPPHFILSA